MKKDSNQCI